MAFGVLGSCSRPRHTLRRTFIARIAEPLLNLTIESFLRQFAEQTILAGISDFNSISAQNHKRAALSRQPPIALAAVGC
jgi:hypothetical protein